MLTDYDIMQFEKYGYLPALKPPTAPTPMKAISLLQPWATLIMLGYKEFETRSWATKHRGALAIAASAGKPAAAREACAPGTDLAQLLANHGLTFDDLPRGVVLGVCSVDEMHKVDETWDLVLGEVELACGDYTAGRYAWALSHVQAFETPVPCKGALSLWEVSAEVEAQFPLSSTPIPTLAPAQDEEPYYDLATPEGQDQYRVAVEPRAATWAENFEEPKQGDGDPYELGQGDDLWIDLVERWDHEFDGDAVSDQDAARQIGTEVCEQVITALVAKRSTEPHHIPCGQCGACLANEPCARLF